MPLVIAIAAIGLFELASHDGLEHFMYIWMSSIMELFHKVLVHLIWPVVLIEPLQFRNHSMYHDTCYFGCIITMSLIGSIYLRRDLSFINFYELLFNKILYVLVAKGHFDIPEPVIVVGAI